MNILPALDIAQVNMMPFQCFSSTAYLLSLKLVYFCVTLLNLMKDEVHLAKQIEVLGKWLWQC
jgi:hypothetical protein